MAGKKEKILIVHNYYQIPGGEDMVVTNEKRMLEDNGHEVTLYTRNNSELKGIGRPGKLFLPITSIFNTKTYKDIRYIIKTRKIDIVHVHNTLHLISPAVYYAALSMKVPVVQTIHNFRLLCPGATFYRNGHICEDCINYGLKCSVKHGCYRKSKLQTLSCVINTNIHRLTGIYKKINYICLTEFNKEKLLHFNQISKEQVFVKPNFVESNIEVIPYEERKNQYIFVGRLDKLKGIDLLLKAWKKMGASVPVLVICGTGPLERWCSTFIQANAINAKMLGFVPNAEARKLIANSKALILPTQWYEGFPMSIVEAYSVRTPVICSDLGNVSNLVIEGSTGYKFKYNSLNDMISAINFLISQPDISFQVNEEYFKNYTVENNYKYLKSIYSAINFKP